MQWPIKLDHTESWCLWPKNGCLWIVVLEKMLESPLDSKEVKPVNPKGNQSWIFIGRTDAEGETPILWPPDAKNRIIWKDPDAGKDADAGRDWGQEEEGTTQDEMAGWHHRLHGHEFEQAPGVGDGREAWVLQSVVLQSQTRLSNWTELIALISTKHQDESAIGLPMSPLTSLF